MLKELDDLIWSKRAVYVSHGVYNDGKRYCTIWANPSNEVLGKGFGATLEEATRAALADCDMPPRSVISTQDPAVALPGLPGMAVR